ncbi:MAG: hypothetical protein AAFX78_08815 [Cyanobacteria bacterium J06638_20]
MAFSDFRRYVPIDSHIRANSHRDEHSSSKPEILDSATKPQKRKRGRPQGRRSNPDYTQISAYIPLKLLLEVQNELTEERREVQRRSPRPVSDLIEELLASWLHNRKTRSGL